MDIIDLGPGKIKEFHQSDTLSTGILEIPQDYLASILLKEKESSGKQIIYRNESGYGRIVFKEKGHNINRFHLKLEARYAPHKIVNDGANPLEILFATNFRLSPSSITLAKNEIFIESFRYGGKNVQSTCGQLKELLAPLELEDISFAYIRIPPETYTDRHKHPFKEFYLVDEGQGRIFIGNNEKLITKNEMIPIQENEEHQVYNEDKKKTLDLLIVTSPRFDASKVERIEKY